MSKKLKALLENFGVENIDEVYDALMDDETDNQEVLDSVLKGAQSYARPFIENELSTNFSEERKSHKGKYMKEAVLIANKTFGGVLTNSEIEKILSAPENKDKTIDAVFNALKEKAISKADTPADVAEIKNMLELSNKKYSELEDKYNNLDTTLKSQYEKDLNDHKLNGVLGSELVRALEGKTSISATKAAKIIEKELKDRAILRLGQDGKINLFDKSNENSPLKKSDTQVYGFDSLVEDIANDFELIQKSNGGERFGGNGGAQKPNDKKEYSGLAAKLEGVTAS